VAALLGKDAIFAADDIKSERVPIPEWGGEVMVRGLTGNQRDAWEASMRVTRGKKTEMDMTNFRARLCVLCVVDETGQLVFHQGDVDDLAGKSGAALDRIYDVAARLSGISDTDVEDLTQDFGKTDGGGSSSA
jgi:L-ascorbate metabolism protein UlaG (beta-lactamase superfamily)